MPKTLAALAGQALAICYIYSPEIDTAFVLAMRGHGDPDQFHLL